MAVVDDNLLDRLRAELEFAQLKPETEYGLGYIAGLDRAIEILEEYED